MPEPHYGLTQIFTRRRLIQFTHYAAHCRMQNFVILSHRYVIYGAELVSQEVSVQTQGAAQGVVCPSVTPPGHPARYRGSVPPSTQTGSRPAYLHSMVRLARLGRLQRATAVLIATLPGSERTTRRHCQGVHPTAWRMQLNPTKCPVGPPHGCPISLVTSTARVKGAAGLPPARLHPGCRGPAPPLPPPTSCG